MKIRLIGMGWWQGSGEIRVMALVQAIGDRGLARMEIVIVEKNGVM